MKDENGIKLTEKEILHEVLSQLSNACCFAFELESSEGKAFAIMIDNAIKYGQVIYNGDDPLDAFCDYTAYEEDNYKKHLAKRKIIPFTKITNEEE